jgi:hypothetical protein
MLQTQMCRSSRSAVAQSARYLLSHLRRHLRIGIMLLQTLPNHSKLRRETPAVNADQMVHKHAGAVAK